MNELQTFTNSEFGELGIIEINGKPYFPATRCAEILGYAKPHNAISTHCRYSLKHRVPHPQNKDKTIEMNFFSEGDLYRLITRFELLSAEKFERWVFDEVLPSIRKHGLYAMDKLLANPDILINTLQALKAERAKAAGLETTVKVQGQQIAEMTPKAGYYDVILSCKDAIAITTIAKDYGKSAVWLNDYLHAQGIQFKQSGIWLLYQKYAESGYTCTRTHNYTGTDGTQRSRIHTYWTQKGRLFLYDLLKKQGYLPLMEQSLCEEFCDV